MTTSNTQVKRVALFGTGRAGSIHLANIVANPRIKLAYIVESDSSSWEACRTKWNLAANNTTFIHPDNVAEVYEDSTLDACIICTPTFTHEAFIIEGHCAHVLGQNFLELVDIDFSSLWLALYWSDERERDRARVGAGGRGRCSNKTRCRVRRKSRMS